MLFTDATYSSIICTNCQNRGWCSLTDIINCGIEGFGLSDQCLSPYDAPAVLDRFLDSNPEIVEADYD